MNETQPKNPDYHFDHWPHLTILLKGLFDKGPELERLLYLAIDEVYNNFDDTAPLTQEQYDDLCSSLTDFEAAFEGFQNFIDEMIAVRQSKQADQNQVEIVRHTTSKKSQQPKQIEVRHTTSKQGQQPKQIEIVRLKAGNESENAAESEGVGHNG